MIQGDADAKATSQRHEFRAGLSIRRLGVMGMGIDRLACFPWEVGTSHLQHLSGWAGWTPDMSQLPELPREVARIIKAGIGTLQPPKRWWQLQTHFIYPSILKETPRSRELSECKNVHFLICLFFFPHPSSKSDRNTFRLPGMSPLCPIRPASGKRRALVETTTKTDSQNSTEPWPWRFSLSNRIWCTGRSCVKFVGPCRPANNEVEVVNRLKRFPKQVRMKTLKLLASFLGHEL